MRTLQAFMIAASAATLFGAALAHAAAGDTTLVSMRAPGQVTAMGASFDAHISANGRFVAFRSQALDIAPGAGGGRIFGYVTDLTTGVTERVTVSSSEVDANTDTDTIAISADGRYVAFGSNASNLVPNDNNAVGDVFVRDRQTGTTQRVSVSSTGAQGGRASYAPCISADGRYVAFGSRAANLAGGDTNNADDIYLRDRQTGQTRRVSLTNSGSQGNGSSYACNFSGNGRFLVFASKATNLVGGDTNASDDAFVRDLVSNTTQRVSVGSGGTQGNLGIGERFRTAALGISADGRYVSFDSLSTNLVAGDTNDDSDVFVHDRQANQTERVSISSGGAQAPYAYSAALSTDGRFVAFDSFGLDGVGSDGIFARDRQTGTTVRVSVGTNGALGNSYSSSPSMSANGRYVTFESLSSTLAPGDGNGASDVFVRDRQSATLRVVSRLRVPSHAAGSHVFLCCDESATGPSISDDGRYVVFVSSARSLVLPDTDPVDFNDDISTRVYLRDRATGETVRLPSGENNAVISGNGRYVAFTNLFSSIKVWDRLTGIVTERAPDGYYNSRLSDDGRYLVYNDSATDNIVVHDSQTGIREPVNVNSAGVRANDWADRAEMSGNGRFVGYVSEATNLAPNDTNGVWDIFLRDRQAHTTERISVSSSGAQANEASYFVDFSDDGRYVAFSSDATNLVAGDTNGQYDVFVRDRQTRQTTRVWVNGQGLGNWTFSMSADGRYLAVWTLNALVTADTNDAYDVYVVDWRTGTAERMSVNSSGAQANNSSILSDISGNGRFVAFNTRATNLGGVDLNELTDVYVHERAATSSSLTLTPHRLGFGSRTVGTTSPAKTVTVRNTGSVALPLSGITLGGTNPGQFARTTNCGASLAAGASCTVSVAFKPTSKGAKSASLVVTPAGGAPPASVALSGTGT